MTDKEKLDAIRAEVEEYISAAHKAHTNITEGNFAHLLSFIDSLQEEPVSEFLNIESMIESYKQRLISQANGVKNSPLIDMCLASYKHGVNETLDTLNLSNVQRTTKNWKEPVSEDLEEACDSYYNETWDEHGGRAMVVDGCHDIWFPSIATDDFFKAGAKWQKEQFEKNRLAHCDALTEEQAQIESDFVTQHLKKNSRTPTFVDAIEYGMRLKEKEMQSTIELAEDHAYFAGRTKTIDEINEALLSEVLPCFMHGGEADEVVAKLDEVLNQKK